MYQNGYYDSNNTTATDDHANSKKDWAKLNVEFMKSIQIILTFLACRCDLAHILHLCNKTILEFEG